MAFTPLAATTCHLNLCSINPKNTTSRAISCSGSSSFPPSDEVHEPQVSSPNIMVLYNHICSCQIVHFNLVEISKQESQKHADHRPVPCMFILEDISEKPMVSS